MKLYTEEQVKYAIKLAQQCDHDCGGVYFDYIETTDIIDEITPIELPSDEEIEERVKQYHYEMHKYGFRDGAKWMRNKIKGGNK